MPPTITKLMDWELVGSGETIVGDGTSQAATVPPNAEIVHMAAEDGVAYYQFGSGGTASALSAGYIPQDGRVIEGPLRDFGRNGMVTFAAIGVNLHIQYYRRNTGR